ncbi:nucleotidyl transferase AbiEii/AbiGii toxin family protein [Mucilaginibacter defluvii]|uniref:Nucleotidyltransferase AbiEii toxin of type IV toxin-antitoxin system n=1 Tax=Mucilaginibacter defluvii TaxID=1196019 RepID=A0ABP9G1H7_9SPHI
MLYWNTVSPALKNNLLTIMQGQPFNEFRLVGGTALSLYWGHRMSIDIDLFTDAPYGSVDFTSIEAYLKQTFRFVQGDFGANPAIGKSYLIGDKENELISWMFTIRWILFYGHPIWWKRYEWQQWRK